MKTIKSVISENSDYKTLINAVVSRIGKESIMGVVNHGIDGGFNGFIYYSDTHKFALQYRKLIVKLLEESAEQMGEDVCEMVNNFGIFKGKMDRDEKNDLYKYLGGAKVQQGSVTNIMAWFAAEEVCRMFDE